MDTLVGRFTKGKYKNQQFEDVSDYGYMWWYYENVDQNPDLKKILDEFNSKYEAEGVFIRGKYEGQKFEDVNDLNYMKWYYNNVQPSPKLGARVHELSNTFSNMISKFEAMKVAFITFTKNLNSPDGIVELPSGLILKFKHIKKYYYGSTPYWLPVIKGDSGVRIKGKKFKVWAEPDTDILSGKTVFVVKKMLKFC